MGTILFVSRVSRPRCLVFLHSQSYNSKGQNPCEIAGSLQAPCLGYCTSSIPLPSSLSQRNRLLIGTYKQPPTSSGRSVTVPTTSPPRRTIPHRRSAGATLSSTACTLLAPSARGMIIYRSSRKPFVKKNPKKLVWLTTRLSRNSWPYWSQFCDAVYVTQLAHEPLSSPQFCGLLSYSDTLLTSLSMLQFRIGRT
jgi:hypothetical protein